MKPFPLRRFLAALLFLSAGVPALAGDRLAVVTTDGPSNRQGRLGHVRECLSILDLGDSQKEQIRGILEAAKPGLLADAAAVRASREKLRTDVASEADACLVGQDFLALRAALASLGADLESVRDSVAATLTPEQRARLEGCLQAPRAESAEDEAEP